MNLGLESWWVYGWGRGCAARLGTKTRQVHGTGPGSRVEAVWGAGQQGEGRVWDAPEQTGKGGRASPWAGPGRGGARTERAEGVSRAEPAPPAPRRPAPLPRPLARSLSALQRL